MTNLLGREQVTASLPGTMHLVDVLEAYLYALSVLVNCCAKCCRGVSSRSGVLEGELTTVPVGNAAAGRIKLLLPHYNQ